MNETYQWCSEELLNFLNHSQEHEKPNSKVVQRSVSLDGVEGLPSAAATTLP